MKSIYGISASKGIVIRKPYFYIFEDIDINVNKKGSLSFKKKILEKAIKETKAEIKSLYKKIKKSSKKEAEIFQAHLLFLEDSIITEKIKVTLIKLVYLDDENNSLVILDQRLLPNEKRFINLTKIEDIWDVIYTD